MKQLFPIYKQPQKRRKLYISGVDMRNSFDGLRLMAVTKLGADFAAGDICYFENNDCKRRKVLLEQDGVVYQLYWMKLKGKFIPVNEQDGVLKQYVDFTQ